ncbi:MAG: Hpt domain-containing protein [Planctomycetia bacterium]|nr:Hpt domain-containing protein [Planctomycetia bacterium]
MATPRLLVLTDGAAERAALAETIGRAGWEVEAADTPADLFQRLHAQRPTAVVVDERQLAGDALERIAQTGAALIVLTADSSRDWPAAAGCITLPFDLQRLAQQFAELVEEDRFRFQFANLTDLGGEELLAEMIDLFREQAPLKLHEARTALAMGDLHTVNRATHSLKSSAANLGAERLRMLAARVERLSADGLAADLPRLLDEMERIYPLVQARLEQRRIAPG